MLDKVIGTFGTLFVILLFAMTSTLFVGMIGQWYAIQNQAQFLAESQGKYGGYTTIANNSLNGFISDFNLDRSKLQVNVSAPGGPVSYGSVVEAEIVYPFEFKLGNSFTPFNVPLTGRGRSVSTYLPNTYNVTYTAP